MELKQKSKDIKISILKMLNNAGNGHTGGSLSTADIFTALYFQIMNIDPKNPNDPSRDRLILSNGHVAPVMYASLAHSGYFPVDELRIMIVDGIKCHINVVNPKDFMDRTFIEIESKELTKALEHYFDTVWEKAKVIR